MKKTLFLLLLITIFANPQILPSQAKEAAKKIDIKRTIKVVNSLPNNAVVIEVYDKCYEPGEYQILVAPNHVKTVEISIPYISMIRTTIQRNTSQEKEWLKQMLMLVEKGVYSRMSYWLGNTSGAQNMNGGKQHTPIFGNPPTKLTIVVEESPTVKGDFIATTIGAAGEKRERLIHTPTPNWNGIYGLDRMQASTKEKKSKHHPDDKNKRKPLEEKKS